MTKILRAYRLDRKTDTQIKQSAQQSNKTCSDVVRAALNQYLNKPEK